MILSTIITRKRSLYLERCKSLYLNHLSGVVCLRLCLILRKFERKYERKKIKGKSKRKKRVKIKTKFKINKLFLYFYFELISLILTILYKN